jgi:hypothetical protein
MSFDKLIKNVVIISLIIAVIGTGIIFFESIILKKKIYKGFYTTWQFPMLLAILIDAMLHKHIHNLNK